MALSKTRTRAEFDGLVRRFRAYAKAARAQADEAKPRTKARIDWTARAEVWEGAALEAEQAKAVLTR